MSRNLSSLMLPLVICIAAAPPSANAEVPFKVLITQLEQIGGFGLGDATSYGDFYAKVTINGVEQSSQASRCNNEGGLTGAVILPTVLFRNLSDGLCDSPYKPWAFPALVPDGPVEVVIKIFDDDIGDDDQAVLLPDGSRELVLVVDPVTGQWSGDVEWPASCNPSPSGDKAVRICWQMGFDVDGDGLLDLWERDGVDVDNDLQTSCPGCPQGVDLDLPAFGADVRHKDLFVEVDWAVDTGSVPRRLGMQTVKQAFARAPANAGCWYRKPAGGFNDPLDIAFCGVVNPDGEPGINLWIDTGTLTDPEASEDGAGSDTCGDGIDNGGDGVSDAADPDCLVADPLGGGNEFVDTGACNGGSDAGKPCFKDEECESLDCEGATPIVAVASAAFQTVKENNFDSGRELVFRYALLGRGCEDGVAGLGEYYGNDFLLCGFRNGSLFMHELGHTLGLGHGGFEDHNCKPNYVSVMNYDNAAGIKSDSPEATCYSGRSANCETFDRLIDYSPPRSSSPLAVSGRGKAPLPELDEANLQQPFLLDLTDADNYFVMVDQGLGACEGVCAGGRESGMSCFRDRHCAGRCSGGDSPGANCNDDGDCPGGSCPDAGVCDGGTTLRADCTTAGECDSASCALGRKVSRAVGERIEAWITGSTDPFAEANLDTVDVIDRGPKDCDKAVNNEISPVSGHDDWSNITFSFFNFRDSLRNAPPGGPSDVVEPTREELDQLAEALNVTDLGIEKSGPANVEAGAEFDYTLRVANHGPNPALGVKIHDALPPEVRLVGASTDCVEESTGSLTCRPGTVRNDADVVVTLTVRADDACRDGLPVDDIRNVATVENVVDPPATDPVAANDVADFTVGVTDSTAPAISCNAPESISPNQAPISFTATVTDACDAAALVEIVGFDCLQFTKKRRRVDKTESCVVTFADDTLTILNAGGVKDRIVWTVRSLDASGNEGFAQCGVDVVRR